MYQKLKRTLNKVGEWFIGVGESIAWARMKQAEFHMYQHCRNLYDIERVQKERERKEGNGIHW